MPPLPENPRNIVFFGETGVGKSSTINLLLETGTFAPVTNNADPCTKAGTGYETTLNGVKYTLWDTRGLGEGRNFFRNIFGVATSSKNELKRFLRERHQRREIDLLVYCVRGSRATKALAKYYNDFCVTTRQLVAPVVILVTQLEREATNMEEWWNRNTSGLEKLKMEFDGHACITTLPGHNRIAESREKLVGLITQKRPWHAQRNGSYFGSPVRAFIPSAPPPRRGGLFRSLFKGGIRNDGPNNDPGSPTVAGSPRSSGYFTAESPGSSVPSSPVVEPPTPCSLTAEPTQIPPINTDSLGVDRPPQSSEGESSSPDSSQYSLHTGHHSSNTSQAEVPLRLYTFDSEDHSTGELPFKLSNASIERRKDYATRHGAFGDIWECNMISGESSTMVAVKAIKLATDDPDNIRPHEKTLRRELKIWAGLKHPNIVPLLGIVFNFGPLPSMVSPWFHNGSLSHYLDQHLSLSKKHLLLEDIAAGLRYLHNNGVIHGDIHSDNVLIDDNGRACLTDFGLSLIKEFVGTSYVNTSMCGAVQFADPALVQHVHKSNDHEKFYPTKPCDVYSFGGLLLHVLSGKKPYDGLSHADIFLEVLKGKRPNIPTYDEHVIPYKPLIQRCWDREEHKRPLANDLAVMFAQQ